VIGVGATTEHACKADYSNTGHSIDIAAPGGGADDTNDPACPPPGGPQGRDIYQMTFPWASAYGAPRTASSYRRFGLPGGFVGTSMSAPHVSAAAALLIASRRIGRNPSPQEVEDRLEATAIDTGRTGHDVVYGAGRLDAAAAVDPLR
jgi:serine protease